MFSQALIRKLISALTIAGEFVKYTISRQIIIALNVSRNFYNCFFVLTEIFCHKEIK